MKLLGLFRSAVKNMLQHGATRRVLQGVVFFLALTIVLSLDFLSPGETLQEGQVSSKSIAAPYTTEYIDEEKTTQAREMVAQTVLPVYLWDPRIGEGIIRDVDALFKSISQLRIKKETAVSNAGEGASLSGPGAQPSEENVPQTIDPGARLKQELDKIKSDMKLAISDNLLRNLLEADQQILLDINSLTVNLLNEVLRYPGVSEDLDSAAAELLAQRREGRELPITLREARQRVADSLEQHTAPPEVKEPVQALLQLFLKPNAFFDADATKQRIREARESVKPHTELIRRDENIVRAGDVVTAKQIKIMEQLGILRSSSNWWRLFGTALMVGAMMMVLILHIRVYQRDLLRNERMISLLGLLILVTVLMAKLIAAIRFSGDPIVYGQLLYMIPIAFGPMLIAILIDNRISIFATILIGLLMGVIAQGSVSHALVAIISSLVGIYSVSRFSQRMDFARAGINMAVVNILVIMASGAVTEIPLMVILKYGVPMGILNGFLSSVLMIGTLPYLEQGFKVTTSVKLLELANPNQPLLRQLLMEAPGTYHHSLLVGNLAESAAEEIGADPLLVRAGAYYHDVGKVKRPAFFIENQQGGQNPHGKIAPTLSTLIITSHVKDGIEMCKEAGLPPAVIDIVEQHHGETLVSYFYHKAVEMDKNESVNQSEFRYAGPKPQTKEAALVMLADTVEAAVRSLANPTLGRIEGLVRKLIKDKLNDGQLEESDLTFKDLDRVAQSFCRTLNGIFHMRIEYPESMLKDMERKRSRNGTVYSG